VKAKHLDLIVVNPVGGADSAFGSDTNRATLIDAAGRTEEIPQTTKDRLADAILDRVAALLKKG
jgi:phosphopantothenoylcysteine synthetase/decarboxylase